MRSVECDIGESPGYGEVILKLFLIFSLSTFEENVLYTDFIRYAIKISNVTPGDGNCGPTSSGCCRLLGIHQRRKICEKTIWLDKLSHLFEVQAEFS